MSILANNAKLIKVGQGYSAGSGISIDDYVISVTGDVGKTYSAGDNINIYEQDNQLFISGKDWEQDIANASANAYNAATAQIPSPFDPTFISAQIDNKLNESDFTAWQSGQYATDLQTIEGQINNKLDSSSFSEVSGNFLTAINIPESATWNETSNVVKESSANWDNTSDIVKESSASWNQGKTYEGISPIVVNNDENKVSADTWTFSAGSNVSFVDDNVNKITRIDCTVTGEGGDPQVNSFVYENSAKINDVNSSYQSNSGTFLTAAPANMATTGDVAELAQTISETYYPNTNPSSFVNEDWVTAQGYITGVDLSEYAERAFVLSSIESATSGKLDVSSFASVSSDFLTNEDLNGYATTAWVDEQGYLTAHQDISNKLDTSAFSDVSGNFLTTSFGISESGSWNDTTNVVQTNSASWGNETISSYTTATIEGTNAINSLNGKALISFRSQSAKEAGVADKARYDYNGNNLADDHNSLTALNGFVQSNSAQWAEGGGNVPVSNSGNLYKVELSGVDLYGYKKTTTIPTEPFYSAVSSQETQYIQYTPYPQWNNYAIQDLRNWSAFDIITVSSNGNEIRPVGYPYGITALNVYYQANYVYDSNNNQLPDFSGYIGKITLDNLVISSYFDKPSYFNDIERCSQFRLWFSGNQHEGQLNNNHYICSVGTEVQSDPETIEGIFVPSATDLSNYYTKSETSGASEIADALANIPTGNPEVENYVQTNSANIDETVTSYQTNSGTFLTAHQAISAEEWNDCYDNVNTNSGAWGGSAIPVSADEGVKIDYTNGMLVFKQDRTLLYSGTTQVTGFTASEPLTNFERVEFIVSPDPNREGPSIITYPMINANTARMNLGWVGNFNSWRNISWNYLFNTNDNIVFTAISGSYFGLQENGTTGAGTWNAGALWLLEVNGINRKV